MLIKKIKIMVIVALVISIILPAVSMAFDGELSFTSLDDGRYISYVEVGHKFDFNIRPYIIIQTNMDEFVGEGHGFHPDNVTYTAGIEYHVNDNLILSVLHLCSHPVDRYGDVLEYNAVKITIRF